MTALFARKALLPGGWTDNVRLTLDGGRIKTVDSGVDFGDEEALGYLMPGLCNAHSHASAPSQVIRSSARLRDGTTSGAGESECTNLPAALVPKR